MPFIGFKIANSDREVWIHHRAIDAIVGVEARQQALIVLDSGLTYPVEGNVAAIREQLSRSED